MKIYFKKLLSGLIPCYDSDKQNYNKLKIDEVYEFDVKHPRNYEFHKKYFALLNLVYANQQKWTDFDGFRAYVVIKSGYSKKYITDKGLLVLPDSISFGNMDAFKFQEMYNSTINFLIREFLPKTTKAEIEEQIIHFF